MNIVTLTASYTDEQAAWDSELALERAGIDASSIDVSALMPSESSPPPKSPAFGRLGSRSLIAGLALGIILAIIGGVIGTATDLPLWVGLAFGAGIGFIAGAYWGAASGLPVSSDLLAAVDRDGMVTRVTVRVHPDEMDQVYEVLRASNPLAGPSRLDA